MSKVVKYKKPKYVYTAGQRMSTLRGALGRLLTPVGIAALSFRHPIVSGIGGAMGARQLYHAAKNPQYAKLLRGKLKDIYRDPDKLRRPKTLKGMAADSAAMLVGPSAYVGGYGYLLNREIKKAKKLDRPLTKGKEKKASMTPKQKANLVVKSKKVGVNEAMKSAKSPAEKRAILSELRKEKRASASLSREQLQAVTRRLLR